jgi:hypothetical protein
MVRCSSFLFSLLQPQSFPPLLGPSECIDCCFPSKHIVVNKDEHVFQLPLPEVATFLQNIDRKSKEKRVNITSTDRTFRYLAKISENNEKESESGTHCMRLALVEDPSLVLGSAGGEFLHNLPTILTLDEGDVRRTAQKRRPG